MGIEQVILGDCLEEMQKIPEKSIDMILTDKSVVYLYENGYTLRHIADIFNTDHHKIKRILTKNNIEITKRKTKKIVSEEKRNKISQSSKGRKCYWKGKKMPDVIIYKNIASKIRFDVSYEFLMNFKDIEKLKFLNQSITNRDKRWSDTDSEWYKNYLTKFYFDDQFNKIYKQWIDDDKYFWLKPTIDHIIPKSIGGKNNIENLQFLSWFENRAKTNMSQQEWDKLKKNINKFLI